MSQRPLEVRLGRRAAARIAREGWRGDAVRRLLGASGGPRWLILGRLDRVLFGQFLNVPRAHPLQAIGSSVGTWRHACLAQEDPVAALARFEDVYLHRAYSRRPDAAEVSAASAEMLAHIFGGAGARRLVEHPWLQSYIVTARGRGATGARHDALLAAGMGAAALANAAGRPLLQGFFQRVVFASRGAPPLPLRDFATRQVALREGTVVQALHASGSIPFVLAGERDIAGAPRGHYWDGGIIDYHFNPAPLESDDLVLYPHFRPDLTTGWFDKFLPWRRERQPRLANLVLLSPSAGFVASLPGGKIPDRSDFGRMAPAARRRYWRECVDRSEALAADFQRRLEDPEPLRDTLVLD